jgi:uncharacterized delta-60 repeat protein
MKLSSKLSIAFSIALAASSEALWEGSALAAPGDPDSTFRSIGYLRAGPGPGQNSGSSVVAQPDFKTVVAGSCRNGQYSDFSIARYNTDGTLDSTFGEGGKVVTSMSSGDDYAVSVTIQADEKIVVGGDGGNQFAVARYNPDGTLDTSFSDDGRAFAGTPSYGGAITLQPDGKIVIVGSQPDEFITHFALARFLPDGTLDPTFNGGVVMTPILDYSDAYAVAYHPDGGIVVAGRAVEGTNQYMVVARYTLDGFLDETFDDDGYAVTGVGLYNDAAAYAVAVQTSLTTAPKIVVAGMASAGPFGEDFAVVRYRNDGSLDAPFGSGGVVITPFAGNGYDAARSVWIQYMGATPSRIVVGGYKAAFNGYDFAVARYYMDGTLDPTFSGDGQASADMSTDFADSRDGAYGMISTAGRILLVGYAIQPSDLDCALARFNDDGTLDTTFDGDGKRLDDAGARRLENRAMLIQPDGKIVTAGVVNPWSWGDFAIFRCLPDGSPDSSFNGDGWVEVAIGPADDELTGLARQADGKLVVAGYALVAPDTNIIVMRLNTDGTADNNFGTGGIVSTRVGGMTVLVEDVAIQSDGKIVVAGNADTGTPIIVVARFDPAGALDGTFGSSGFTTVTVGSGAFARAMALQSDGRIVIAGGCYIGADTDIAVVRLNVDGALDLSFAGNGRVITTVSGNADEATDVVVRGGIVVAGVSGYDWDLVLARYNMDGSLDMSFDGDGLVVTPITNYRVGPSLAIQPNSRIIVAGRRGLSFPEYFDFAVSRYERTGAVDSTYGNAGIVDLDLGAVGDYAAAVAVDAEGKAVVAGTSDGLFSIARLHGDGTITGVEDGERLAAPVSGLFVGAPHPNPSTHGTAIRFRTSESGPLTASIVDVTGRLVRCVVGAEPRNAGEHLMHWDGRDDSGNMTASGTYFLRLRHGSLSGEQKVTVLR